MKINKNYQRHNGIEIAKICDAEKCCLICFCECEYYREAIVIPKNENPNDYEFVIHCRDCIHYDQGGTEPYGLCHLSEDMVANDYFCGEGEKRNE